MEVTQAIMKAGMSQGLQVESVNWRPRNADGLVPI